ncbi:MAG: YwmB family TATA-box binding protein [Desulfotomaculales bacterium]
MAPLLLGVLVALLGLWYPWWGGSTAGDPARLLEAAGACVDRIYCYAVRDVRDSAGPPTPEANLLHVAQERPCAALRAGPARSAGREAGTCAAAPGARTFRTAYATLPGPPPQGPLALARTVARQAGVVVLEEMADGNLASVAGYAPGWGPALWSGRGYVNLQVGVRYDPGTRRTRVAAGTPAVFPDF